VISIDANILLYAFSEASPAHQRARTFLEDLTPSSGVGISELVLVEFYTLLRNPAVLTRPLRAFRAVDVIQAYRRHPNWSVLGFDSESPGLHDGLWEHARRSGFVRRRIYDARLALLLRRQGVTEFATANVKDFEGFGFERLWNPVDR
jgi:toxin-antitoxin system PIN domain toxin